MDASVVKFECDAVDDGYNNTQLDADSNECDTQGDSEALHSHIFPQYMHAASSGFSSQSSVMDDGVDEDSGNVGTKSPQLWTAESLQEASSSDNRTQQQPQQSSAFAQRPQKSNKMWLGSRRRKKWSSMYGNQLRCPKCPEAFLHKRSLSRHIMINHGPKVYFWCMRCCRFYNRRDNLRSHYRSHHPKHLRDLDHIQGVGRESLLLGEQTPSFRSTNRPLNSSSCSTLGSSQIISRNDQSVPSYSTQQSSNSSYTTNSITSTVAAKPWKSQAAQLMEREQGAISTRQQTLKIRTSFANTGDCKSNAKGATCAADRQSGLKSAPERQLPTLSVPPAGINQESKRPCMKAHAIPSTDARGNSLSVRDVLEYQRQRESNYADEDVVKISDDSSSNGEIEPPTPIPSSQGTRDEGVERLQQGTPFEDLQIEKVMEGRVTRVIEEHQTFIYSRGEKIRTERRKRIYNVLHLDGVGQGVNQTPQPTIASTGLTREEQLEKNLKGQVTKVTERSSKYTYASGQKVTKEKTSRVYDVMLLAGLTNV